MANPALAPYGLAYQKVLDPAGFQGERILTNNVIQARQYLSLGLAEVGLIAASVAQGFAQVIEVDASLYPAIKQQLLIVKPSAQAQAFVSFLASSDALDMIEQFGYQRPEP